MKARPIKIVDGQVITCHPSEATYLEINMPGPQGRITLPVVLGNATREGTGCWSWDGSVSAPTLKPSLLITSGHFAGDPKAGDRCWCDYNREHPDNQHFSCFRCHTHINDGVAHFLEDCSHPLASKSVPLLDMPE